MCNICRLEIVPITWSTKFQSYDEEGWVEQKLVVLQWVLQIQPVEIWLKNVNDQTPMYWAVKRGNRKFIETLYATGETFAGRASEFPGCSRKLLSEVAYSQGHFSSRK